MAGDAARSIFRFGLGLMISLDCIVATLQASPPGPVVQAAPRVARGEPTPASPRVAPVEEASEEQEPKQLAPAPAEESPLQEDLEVIQERYPSRAVKIERQVIQDAEGNYSNHGLWTMWDEQGRKIGTGEFRNGERHGTWTRWYAPGQAELFKSMPFARFEGPFVSEATFLHGKLHGTWTIVDSQERMCCAWEFENGERHGKAIWWYPNGQKMREVDYRDGEMDGELREWALDSKLTVRHVYKDGRRRAIEVEEFSPGVKKIEAEYVYAREITSTTYDWWNAAIITKVLGKDGEDMRSGGWTSWFKSGQKQLEGRYENDRPVGKFTWWHPNGQKAIEGDYIDGKQAGKWSWWHINGQKQIVGEYEDGTQRGKWTWWSPEGKVAEVADFSAESRPVERSAPMVSGLPRESRMQGGLDSKPGPAAKSVPRIQR